MQPSNQAASEPVRLFLLSENKLLRDALCRLLATEPDFQVVAQCGFGGEALYAAARGPTEVVLLDHDSGPLAARQFLLSARAAGWRGRILVMTEGMSSEDSLQVLQLGVSGIFRKGDGLGGLIKAVRLVAGGEAWLDQEVIRALADRTAGSKPVLGARLTERERQVLEGVMEGLTNKRIAQKIGIPEGAVKATLRKLFQKAGVGTRSQLIRRALDGSL